METQSEKFLFVGSHLALDWVNTEIVSNGQVVSLIGAYADLRDWLATAGVMKPAELETAEANWSEAERDALVRNALAFRGQLRTMAERIAADQPVGAATIGAINRWLAERRGVTRLEATEAGYKTTFQRDWRRIEALLAPIAEAAADLLANGDLSLVRKCEGPECVLFFYDTTKNHARRWCSMSGCGNRHKAAAHYRRTRQKSAETA